LSSCGTVYELPSARCSLMLLMKYCSSLMVNFSPLALVYSRGWNPRVSSPTILSNSRENVPVLASLGTGVSFLQEIASNSTAARHAASFRDVPHQADRFIVIVIVVVFMKK